METKGFFQFEIIINVLVSSFCFIWISMFWVYDNYNMFNYFSAGTVFRRQILTSEDGLRSQKSTLDQIPLFVSW